MPHPRGTFIADPFLVSAGSQTIAFVEEYHYRDGRAVIAAYDVGSPEPCRVGTALSESFHLSFPFVFEVDGELLMCPESAQARDLRLYRCIEFQLKWELAHVVMSAVEVVDALFLEVGGSWYILATTSRGLGGDTHSTLSLFSTGHSPFGRLQECRRNPVILDSRCARNGGMVQLGDRLIRCGQRQGFGVYGKELRL